MKAHPVLISPADPRPSNPRSGLLVQSSLSNGLPPHQSIRTAIRLSVHQHPHQNTTRTTTMTSPTAARAHRLFSGTLAVGFLVVAIAYIAAASRRGFSLPNNGTGMTAMWAAILGTTGLLAEVITHRQQQQEQQQGGQAYATAARAFQALLLVMLMVATISLACLKDTHGAVWSALAALALGAVLASRRRFDKAGEPKPTPVVPLKASNNNNDTAAAPAATASPVVANNLAKTGCRGRCARCCCLWTPLALATVIAVAFGIGSALTAREQLMLYPAPGTHYLLKAAPDSDATVRVHMHCVGPRPNPTRPVVVFEHGGGASSFGFFGVQQRLAALGVRSCAYDRPGFGWSEALPVGGESLANYEHLLSSLLQAAGEQPPYVLVGHSAGVELVQVYAHNHPQDVAAVSLLDGYPNYLLLLGLTEAQAKQQEGRVCGILQAARAFEGAGLLRPIFSRRPTFDPPSEAGRQSSTYTNGHNFDSQWRVFCTAQDPRATEYLTAAAKALPAAQQGENPTVPSVKWPRTNAAVQIISASSTVLPPAPQGGGPNVYAVQARAYNETLSATGDSEWLVCDPCTHGFVYEKTEYLAAQLLRLVQRV